MNTNPWEKSIDLLKAEFAKDKITIEPYQIEKNINGIDVTIDYVGNDEEKWDDDIWTAVLGGALKAVEFCYLKSGRFPLIGEEINLHFDDISYYKITSIAHSVSGLSGEWRYSMRIGIE